MLAASHVVEEYNLSVFLGALELDSLGAVAWRFDRRVDIDDLSVTPVSEDQPLLVVRINSEVRRVVTDRLLSLPVEVRQIGSSRHELLLSFKNLLEVVNLKSIGQVDVCGDLLVVLLLSQEDDRGHAAGPNFVLSCGERSQERRVLVVGV